MQEGLMRDLERFIVLQVVDVRWREHLENMDYMREGIHLRGMAQKDPLVEYRNEGHVMFLELNRAIREEVVALLFHAQITPGETRTAQLPASSRRRTGTAPTSKFDPSAQAIAYGLPAPNGDTDADERRRRSGPSRWSSPRTRASAATTPAGAARARSTSAATAPDSRGHVPSGHCLAGPCPVPGYRNESVTAARVFPAQRAFRRCQAHALSAGRGAPGTIPRPWLTRRHRSRSSSKGSGPSSTGSVITFDPARLTERRAALEAEMNTPGFWDDQARAQKTSTEHARVSKRIETYEQARRASTRTHAISTRWIRRWPARSTSAIGPLHRELERLEEAALFNGDYDTGDAVVTLQSGTGGTDAQDWTEMMLRMYERWGSRARLQDRPARGEPGRGGGPQELDLHDRGRERLRRSSRPSAASTGSCASRRSTPPTAARRRSRP